MSVWKVGPKQMSGYLILDSDGDEVCEVFHGIKPALPDAHLIAAAPEMYDFIATLENDDGKIPDWLWEKRNEILAKATGKEK